MYDLVSGGSVVGSDSHGAGGGPNRRPGPFRSFDWRTERSSGLWNLAFLARGAEIMALSSGRGPTFYSQHTHPTLAHSEGIWLCSQSSKNVWCKAVHDGSSKGLQQWFLFKGYYSILSRLMTQKLSSLLKLNVIGYLDYLYKWIDLNALSKETKGKFTVEQLNYQDIKFI